MYRKVIGDDNGKLKDIIECKEDVFFIESERK